MIFRRLLILLNVLSSLLALTQTGTQTSAANLGMLEGTKISASSVNGNRGVDDPYYGALNLFDGGEHRISNINYTSWLTDNEARHWVKLQFEAPVEVDSIMIEVPGKPSAILNPAPPFGVYQCATSMVPTPRPTEFAVDLTVEQSGAKITRKLQSVEVTGFRLYYPLEKPVRNVTEVTVVFPGPSMLEVSELEVMGVPRKPGTLRIKKADGSK
jgi:hypothetical protein